MSRQYRFLQYVVDPFAGRCVTVAGLVRDGGRVRVFLAPFDRTLAELGVRAANLLRSLRRDIEGLDSFDRLPRSFGPQLILTKAEHVPSNDAAGWMQSRLSSDGPPHHRFPH